MLRCDCQVRSTYNSANYVAIIAGVRLRWPASPKHHLPARCAPHDKHRRVAAHPTHGPLKSMIRGLAHSNKKRVASQLRSFEVCRIIRARRGCPLQAFSCGRASIVAYSLQQQHNKLAATTSNNSTKTRLPKPANVARPPAQ